MENLDYETKRLLSLLNEEKRIINSGIKGDVLFAYLKLIEEEGCSVINNSKQNPFNY